MFGVKMKNKFLNKRGATSLSILLFVILSILLISYTIFTFLTQKNKYESISLIDFNDIHLMEEKISFYVSNGVSLDEAVKIVKDESNIEVGVNGKEVLIEKEYFDDKKVLIMKVSYKSKIG